MDRIESCEDTQVRFMFSLECEDTRVSIHTGIQARIEITAHNKRYLGETLDNILVIRSTHKE